MICRQFGHNVPFRERFHIDIPSVTGSRILEIRAIQGLLECIHEADYIIEIVVTFDDFPILWIRIFE